MKKFFITLFVIAIIFGAANFVYLNYGKWQYNLQPVNISGTLIPIGKNLPAFSLKLNDKNFSDANLLNKWSILFFGYTRCPDICPNTLSVLNKMYKELDDEFPRKKRPHVTFISIDPEHDKDGSPDKYAKYFNKHFIGLTGNQSQLDLLTQSLGAVASRVKTGDNPDDYIFDHSSTLFVINPDGQLQAILTAPFTHEQLARDYRILVNKYSQ